MKTVVAIGLLLLALSFCNLMGRRSANDANTRDSGTVAESSPAENSNTTDSARPPTTVGSGAAPQSAGPPGVRTLNQNSAASAPPPPPPKPTALPIVSGGVLNGKATYLPKPAYPPIAKSVHATGTVNVRVTIDENGSVISASAVSGHPLLQASAVAAARQAKFTPTKLSGQTVKVTGIIVYNFVEQ
jgi:TonB family protein